MRLPRDVSADGLIKRLKQLGYGMSRQTGSHVRVTTVERGEHHITIPNHSSLRVGTLNSILSDIADHFGIEKEELIKLLFP